MISLIEDMPVSLRKDRHTLPLFLIFRRDFGGENPRLSTIAALNRCTYKWYLY